MELIVCKKEILYYGKKELHKILCLRFASLDGKEYIKPLTYASKGKDDKYYYNYVIVDYLEDNKTIAI